MNTNQKLMTRKARECAMHTKSRGKWPKPRGTKPNAFGYSAQRTVYYDKRNGWVIKVEKWDGANLTEWETYERLKDELKGHELYRVPWTTLIDNVIVMEYIEGEVASFVDNPNWEFHENKVEDKYELSDMHSGNVIWDGKFFWLVDLGFC